jgi:hypothetical protein
MRLRWTIVLLLAAGCSSEPARPAAPPPQNAPAPAPAPVARDPDVVISGGSSRPAPRPRDEAARPNTERIEELKRRATAGSGPSTDAWKAFTSDEGRFSILSPTALRHETETVDTPAGRVAVEIFSAVLEGPDKRVFLVEFLDLPKTLPTVADTRQFLAAMLDAEAKRTRSKLSESRWNDLYGLPACEGRLDLPSGAVMRLRIIVSGRRVYQLNGVAPKDDAASRDTVTFIESFRINR